MTPCRALHAIIDDIVALALVVSPALVAIGVLQLMQTLATRFSQTEARERGAGVIAPVVDAVEGNGGFPP